MQDTILYVTITYIPKERETEGDPRVDRNLFWDAGYFTTLSVAIEI
jgi:hypothetical protein